MLSPLKSHILSFVLLALMSLSVKAAGFAWQASCSTDDVCVLSVDSSLPFDAVLSSGFDDDVPLQRLPGSKYASSTIQLGKILTACRHFPSICRKVPFALLDYRIKIESQTFGRLNAADYYVFTLRRIII